MSKVNPDKKDDEKLRPVFTDFDREVIARLPITPKQREELIKSMSTTSASQVSVKVMSKPSVGRTPHVNV
jgi:uncharacterized protein YggU (UPF0235/DUF167 family)